MCGGGRSRRWDRSFRSFRRVGRYIVTPDQAVTSDCQARLRSGQRMKQPAIKTSRQKPPEPASVRIERVGSTGDGIARLLDGTPLYLPFTLPGESVMAR